MSQLMQQQITILYDLLTHNDDFGELKYWLTNTLIGQKANFIAFYYQINLQKEEVRRDLNKLSETIEKLQMLINQCHHVVLIEQEKDQNFKKHYEKYYKKLRKKQVNI